MPLKTGKKNIGANVEELRHKGYPEKQAVAIAIDASKKRKVH